VSDQIAHGLSKLGGELGNWWVARLFVRAFLNDNRSYGWLAIPADTVIYLDKLSPRKRPLPQFLPEFSWPRWNPASFVYRGGCWTS